MHTVGDNLKRHICEMATNNRPHSCTSKENRCYLSIFQEKRSMSELD